MRGRPGNTIMIGTNGRANIEEILSRTFYVH
jgi:hypothetical protein